MIPVTVLPAAEADLEDAWAWYEAESFDLAAAFTDEIRRTLRRIRETPLQFPLVGKKVRRALLRRFPYAIYFVLRDQGASMALIGILHQKRKPSLWKQREKKEG